MKRGVCWAVLPNGVKPVRRVGAGQARLAGMLVGRMVTVRAVSGALMGVWPDMVFRSRAAAERRAALIALGGGAL